LYDILEAGKLTLVVVVDFSTREWAAEWVVKYVASLRNKSRLGRIICK
jgi:hypothetical protein